MGDLEKAEQRKAVAWGLGVLTMLLLVTGNTYILVYGAPIVAAAIVGVRWYGVDVP